MSDLPETADEMQDAPESAVGESPAVAVPAAAEAESASLDAIDVTPLAVAEQAAPLLVTQTPQNQVERILEALLLASEVPLSLEQLHRLVGSDLGLNKKDLREALERLAASLEGRASQLCEVASGWRIQVRAGYGEWVARLYQEKPPRLSRALLETLALVCYRQPITRGEIEEVRGVALSPNIVRTLLDRGWIREVGVKEVPGRPSLFGTTHQLLDDLNVKSLDELPSLPQIKDPKQLEAALARLGEQLHETPALEAGDGSQAVLDQDLADAPDEQVSAETTDGTSSESGADAQGGDGGLAAVDTPEPDDAADAPEPQADRDATQDADRDPAADLA